MTDLEIQLNLVGAISLKINRKTKELTSLLAKRMKLAEEELDKEDKDLNTALWISTPLDNDIEQVRAEIKRLGFNLRKETLQLEKLTRGYNWFNNILIEKFNREEE